METPPNRTFEVEDGGFIALVILISVAFAYLLAPYFGAVLWGVVAAIMFQPLSAKLANKLGGRKNVAASLVLLGLIAVFVIPTILLGINLVNEASSIYNRIVTGQIDITEIVRNLQDALPESLRRFIAQYGIRDFEQVRTEFGSSITSGLQALAGRLLSLGQGALSFIAALGVMLYLSFFLLRDGDRYGLLVRESLPLNPETRDSLVAHFLLVVRATMRGTVVVAVVQGALGGILFSALGPRCDLSVRGRRSRQGRNPRVLRRLHHRHGGQCPAPHPRRPRHPHARLRRVDLNACRARTVRPQRLHRRSGDRRAVHGRVEPAT